MFVRVIFLLFLLGLDPCFWFGNQCIIKKSTSIFFRKWSRKNQPRVIPVFPPIDVIGTTQNRLSGSGFLGLLRASLPGRSSVSNQDSSFSAPSTSLTGGFFPTAFPNSFTFLTWYSLIRKSSETECEYWLLPVMEDASKSSKLLAEYNSDLWRLRRARELNCNINEG